MARVHLIVRLIEGKYYNPRYVGNELHGQMSALYRTSRRWIR